MKEYFIPFSQTAVMMPLKSLVKTPVHAIHLVKDDKKIYSKGFVSSLSEVTNTPLSIRQKIVSEGKDFHYAHLAEYGACHSFSIVWLSLILREKLPYTTVNQRLDSLQKNCQKIVQLQKDYCFTAISTQNPLADHTLLQSQGLHETGVVEGSLLGGTLLEKITIQLMSEMHQPTGAAFLHSFSYIDNGQTARHTIAYFRPITEVNGRKVPIDNNIIIFDPNFGEACIQIDQLPNALSNLFTYYGARLTASILRGIDNDPTKQGKYVSFNLSRARPLAKT